MGKLVTEVILEWKGLRLYRTQLFISLFLIPFSYAFILLLSLRPAEGQLSFVLSGLMVASLLGAGSLVGLRVANLVQPEVLELYATLPIGMGQAALGVVIAYVVLVIPQSVVLLGLSSWWAGRANPGMLVAGAVTSVIALFALWTALGLLVRNPFKAQGMFSLIAWALLLFSPIYYEMKDLPFAYRALLLVNPVTHALNVIRPFLGMDMQISYLVSFLYLGTLTCLLLVYSVWSLRKLHMLEKLF